jgi:hypothetical protein
VKKPVTIIVVTIVLAFLGIRTLAYVSSQAGRCMLFQQPSIVIGASASLTVQLECAVSTRTPAPATTTTPVTAVSGPSLTPGNTPGTYYINCSVAQCVRPGFPNGPYGTTCDDVVNGKQFCHP